MAKFYNAHVEGFERLFDCKYYRFNPRSVTEIPEVLSEFVERETKIYGIFKVVEGMTAAQFADAEWNALHAVLKQNHYWLHKYNKWKDEQKIKGVTMDQDTKNARKIKHYISELTVKLGAIKPLEKFPTFEGVELGKEKEVEVKPTMDVEKLVQEAAALNIKRRGMPKGGWPKKVSEDSDENFKAKLTNIATGEEVK